jgi:hypothetical protein
MFGRRFADLLLFCVTSAELVILFLLTPTNYTKGTRGVGNSSRDGVAR